MDIAYCSMWIPESGALVYNEKVYARGISAHKLARALIFGMEHHLGRPVSLFNVINTPNFPKIPSLLVQSRQWAHVEGARDYQIGFINLFGIKYITQAVNLYKSLARWVKQSTEEKHAICVHYMYYPFMVAACALKRKYGDRVVLCLITGDLVGKYTVAIPGYERGIKQKALDFVNKRVEMLAKQFEGFVFATKEMASALCVEEKPFSILECAYLPPENMDLSDEISEDEQHKTIFYAGVLREEYGISHLLRAFSMIEYPEYRLWIAGAGEAAFAIKEYAKKDKRIELLGYLTPQEVNRRQKVSTVLINPRTSGYEYVKYSFPSKTMECLASGKPFIAHCLPCDPPEYAAYIQYAEGESDEALKSKIVEICKMGKEQRDKIGEKGRQFILQEKNPQVMSKRILDILDVIGE